jgi:hypothetical protein
MIDPPLFILDVIPLNHLQVENNDIDELQRTTLYVTPLPEEQHMKQSKPWAASFRRSMHNALRGIANPMATNLMDDVLPAFLEDTFAKVESILTSGLPLPKSPSLQAEQGTFERDHRDRHRLHQATNLNLDSTKLEREERGWWTLRFHQVLREMGQQDLSMANS